MAEVRIVGFDQAVKGVRGISALRAALPQLHVLVPTASTPLEPGTETAIDVPIAVPPNARLTELYATLALSERASKAGGLTQEAVVSVDGADKTYNVSLPPSAAPRNVSVRLDGGSVVWNRGGEVPPHTYELPELSAAANAAFDAAGERIGDPPTLRFLVRSDTGGAAAISVRGTPAFVRMVTETWPNERDGSLRADRNLELELGANAVVPLRDDGLAASALERLSLDVGGTFEPPRVLDRLVDHDDTTFVTVSPEFFVAQQVSVAISIQCVGLGGVLVAGADGEIHCSLEAAGPDGMPASGTALASATLPIARDDTDGAPGWRFVSFASPVSLVPNGRYWAVFRGVQGKAWLGLHAVGRSREADDAGAGLLVSRGGQSWRALDESMPPRFEGAVRLTYLPTVDTQAGALEVTLLAASAETVRALATHRVEPAGAVQTIELAPPSALSAGEHIGLRVVAYGKGRATIANVIREYRA